MAALFAFLHHLAAFALFAVLVLEFVLLRDPLTLLSARRLLTADMIYGISAGLLLIIGFVRVFYFEKGSLYYFHSWAFSAKIGLFILIGLISIAPTREFLSWRGALRRGQVPLLGEPRRQKLRMILHLELAGVVLILLCAALMAKGIGIMS